MSEQEPTRNYVYQPLPGVGHEHEKNPAIYGVSGPDVKRPIVGTTKVVAEDIARRLNEEHGR